ncbi:MAG: tyrosine-type recombinase/integrase [Kiritimatiellae bacterium]|nr:tyrosine-type recombinase/integrase [Kiritimatiellia bacterium]
MARLNAGCITKKGKKYYLVYKNKWLALKTEDKAEAERRAVDFVPGLVNPKTGWLEFLVELGEKAKAQLIREAAPIDVEWDNLFWRWSKENKRLTQNAGTLRAYEGAVNALGGWAKLNGVEGPGVITHGEAAKYLEGRSAEAGKRDCRLFARIFKGLGLDAGIWEGHDLAVAVAGRFRRISKDEMRRLLEAAADPVECALLRLGFSTGLRLGSCLEIDERAFDGDFLRVIPGKTRAKKGRPLLIPMLPRTRLALEGVAPGFFRRLRADTASNRMKAIFVRAGVGANQFGSASFHSLRATFISMMDEAGVSPHITDAITGHASQGMHGRYSQPSRSALMEAVKKAVIDLDY